MSNRTDLDLLLVRYFDGSLDEAGRAELLNILQDQEGARREFRLMAEQVFAVADQGRCAEAREVSRPFVPRQPAGNWVEMWRRLLWPIAACLTATALGLAIWHWRGEAKRSLLEVTELEGTVTWVDAGAMTPRALVKGARLPAGRLELSADGAVASFRFADSTVLSFHGRTEATLLQQNGKQIRLPRGHLTANVAPQPVSHPFRIQTVTAEVVVKGTTFSVDALPDHTSLEVASGLVNVRRLVDGREVAVGQNQRLVASLDGSAPLVPQAREWPGTVWQKRFDQHPGPGRGRWNPPGPQRPEGALASEPFAAGTQPDGRVVVHHGLSVEDPEGLATLKSKSVLRLRLRTDREAELQLMIATLRPNGQFGGNFMIQSLNCPATAPGAWRNLSIPVRELRKITPGDPPGSDGLIVTAILLNSLQQPAGLELAELSITESP